MPKKVINQNRNYNSEFLDSIGSNFIFDENPINRLNNTANLLEPNSIIEKIDKKKELTPTKFGSRNRCSNFYFFINSI